MAGTVADYFVGDEDLEKGHGWQLRARTLDALRFPVPTLQPTTPGKPLALDLQPLGKPVESPGNGWTWVDCCDADVMHNNDTPVVCGRLGIKTILGRPSGYVGSVTYNGAPAERFYVETGMYPRWGWNEAGHFFPVANNTYQIGGPGYAVSDIVMAFGSLKAKIAQLEARLAALEN